MPASGSDGYAQCAQAGNTAFQHIAGLHGTYTFGGAGHDEVTGLQLPGLGKHLNSLSNIPDELVHMAALAVFAVDLQPDFCLLYITRLCSRRDGADGGAVLKGLANAPGAALLFHVVLQIAARHVQAYGIAPDMFHGLRGRNVFAAFANRYHQLDFVVQIAGQRGVGHADSATVFCGQYGICGLHEEKRCFAPRKAHIFGVLRVVAAYAVDAVYGKTVSAANDRHRGLGWGRKHKWHGSGLSSQRKNKCAMSQVSSYAVQVTDTKHLQQLWLQPDWPAIAGVHALFTTRAGGQSAAPWNAMNLGDHVHDDPQHVAANRALLQAVLSDISGRPVQTRFLQQVHGCDVQFLEHASPNGQAFDACLTTESDVACIVMVADCLPVLLAHRSGRAVAAAHAGWRGLAGHNGHGVLEAVWQAYAARLGVAADAQLAAETQVWLGPCIGPEAFEVGDEVREAFVQTLPAAVQCFVPVAGKSGKWLANLSLLARQRLQAVGLTHIYGNDGSAPWCTVSNASRFFSHRRDAAVLGSTGRMAACIWKG